MIQKNILRIRQEIALVCKKIGRDPKEITLVAVTKSADLNAIKQVIAAGISDVAENRVSEVQEKFSALGYIRRHLIGHLQTNKVKDAIAVCDLIQSVDSLKLVLEIQKQANKINRSVDILVQVNTSGEPQKFGVTKTQALELVGKIKECP